MSTISAISTPLAEGGISVIRISGEDAVAVAERVFKPATCDSVQSMNGYTCAYGQIRDGERTVDDGMLTVFRAPHSYTGEDVCEISCHGGIYVTRRVMTACLKAGSVPAASGEFTKRALLNGKMSLTEAEAVADIISAQGEQILGCANSQREGALYRRAEAIAGLIMDVSAQISAWIDYPEDDTPTVTAEWLTERLNVIKNELDGLLSGYDTGRMIRDGISCAIVGKPNVGKSTIMNALTGVRRSIVSDVAGTTRDIVEETVNLNGTVLLLSDCAGIRETDDEIEKIGVEIMLEKLENADIVLAVFDGSRAFEDEDRRLLERLNGKTVIPIVNKSDLENKLDANELAALGEPLKICAKSDDLSKRLGGEISARLKLDLLDTSAGFLANERQRACVITAAEAADRALTAVLSGVTPDVVGVELERALDAIYELSGKRASDEVINEVFKRFCVGK